MSFGTLFSLIRYGTKHTINARLLANLTRAHNHLPYKHCILFIIIRHGIIIQGEGSHAR